MSLVPPHGGLARPVDRVLPLSKKKTLAAEAASMPKIEVTDADAATLGRFADGTLSPFEGPMTRDVYDRILETKSFERNGETYAWAIPMSLPVTDEESRRVEAGKPAALYDSRGELIGALHVESSFDWDKERYVEKVYGTKRMDHPGAEIVTSDERTVLVGGTVDVLPPAAHPEFGQYVLSPLETRALIAARKWESALAFQTRNPLHRAHEYALVYGVEELTRKGLFAGVVLNPLVGSLKGDDVDATTRMKTYEVLLKRRLLGKGDADEALWQDAGYSLADVFALVGLDIKMFYGGPSEAVMHAIYRQNHGFSHIVIGRKHADAPYRDGSPIWGDFDAQEIFENLPGALETEPVRVGFAAYYESMGRVDLMSNHEGEKAFFISGTKVRETLLAGERPDERIMRPETADILIEAYRSAS